MAGGIAAGDFIRVRLSPPLRISKYTTVGNNSDHFSVPLNTNRTVVL